MVDNVRFGPARPVLTTRTLAASDIIRSPQSGATRATPQTLSLASALAQQGPPYDAGKVAHLRAAIASGAYKIDLGSVADSMIHFGGGQRV